MTDKEKMIMLRLCAKVMEYANLSEDKEADNLIQWVLIGNNLKENNNEIRKITAEYKNLKSDVYNGVHEALKINKEICKRRDELYEKHQDLKSELNKIEKDLVP